MNLGVIIRVDLISGKLSSDNIFCEGTETLLKSTKLGINESSQSESSK